MAGRPPKPTKLKLLQGNPGKRELNKNEPNPQVGEDIPKPPSWMETQAKKEWKRIVPELHRLELLTMVDHPSLVAYCQAYARFVECEKIIKKQGMTFETPNGYVQQRPEIAISNNAQKIMKEFAAQFGLTPSSRGRLNLPDQKENKDEFEEFLKRG